ncbi:BA14K-like protein [Rhizobium sp. RU36D]|nr:BA14K-like protein [Rhizobium sp. RU36D]
MSILRKHLPMMAMVVAAALTNVTPSMAMPRVAVPAAPASDVVNVQYYDGYYGRRHYRDDGYYYRGHRGYREYRPGYRRHDNGMWFPLAAFAAGALIAGAVAAPSAPRRVYGNGGLNPRHYDWCQGRYRSYDAYSNTFQPYNGPRQQCYSPFY